MIHKKYPKTFTYIIGCAQILIAGSFIIMLVKSNVVHNSGGRYNAMGIMIAIISELYLLPYLIWSIILTRIKKIRKQWYNVNIIVLFVLGVLPAVLLAFNIIGICLK